MINNYRVFIDTIDRQVELNHLKLFKTFLDIYPKDISKEELIFENNKLQQSSFIDLINKYYE